MGDGYFLVVVVDECGRGVVASVICGASGAFVSGCSEAPGSMGADAKQGKRFPDAGRDLRADGEGVFGSNATSGWMVVGGALLIGFDR